MSDPRRASLEAVIDVLERNVFVDDSLSSTFVKYNLSRKDTALATEIIYGVTRNKLFIDFLLSKVSRRELKSLSFNLRNLLRIAVYQLEFMRIPQYAAVDSAVNIAKKIEGQHIASYVNGVLRNLLKKRNTINLPQLSKNPVFHLSVKFSHPAWLVKRWMDTFGLDSTINLLSYNNMPPQTTIHPNLLKINIEDLLKALNEQNIIAKISTISTNSINIGNIGSIKELSGFYEGLWFVQDEISSLVPELLNPQQDELVIDMCAAPGTKTAKLAGIMNNTGKIIALDLNEKRLEKIKENCFRLGITNVETCLADATVYKLPDNMQADKVLLDAPCTNTGVFAKRADARWRRKPKDLTDAAILQKELIKNASSLLKTNGTLIYSVCSIEPEEGIDVYNYALENLPLVPITSKDLLPQHLHNFFQNDYLQFYPFQHLSDGFFIAAFKKT